jgi:hypothetical protein
MAWPNVRHGKVKEQGLVSDPSPDMKVRLFWAIEAVADIVTTRIATAYLRFAMIFPPQFHLSFDLHHSNHRGELS